MRKLLSMSLIWLCAVFIGLSPQCLRAQTVWNGTADTSWYSATQSSFDIFTPEQLAGVALLVNNNITDFAGKSINLTDDIRLNLNAGDSSNNWDPIGGAVNATGETGTTTYYFRGNFNGNGHTIYNMYCNNGIYAQAGLFGALKGTLTIQKLAMANPVVKGAGMLGVIAGYTNYGGAIYI